MFWQIWYVFDYYAVIEIINKLYFHKTRFSDFVDFHEIGKKQRNVKDEF